MLVCRSHTGGFKVDFQGEMGMQVQQNTSELKKQLHHHVLLPCRVGLVASLRDNVIVVDKYSTCLWLLYLEPTQVNILEVSLLL